MDSREREKDCRGCQCWKQLVCLSEHVCNCSQKERGWKAWDEKQIEKWKNKTSPAFLPLAVKDECDLWFINPYTSHWRWVRERNIYICACVYIGTMCIHVLERERGKRLIVPGESLSFTKRFNSMAKCRLHFKFFCKRIHSIHLNSRWFKLQIIKLSRSFSFTMTIYSLDLLSPIHIQHLNSFSTTWFLFCFWLWLSIVLNFLCCLLSVLMGWMARFIGSISSQFRLCLQSQICC